VKKILSILLFLIVILGIWYWMKVAPSSAESHADQAFVAKNYDQASMMYSQALLSEKSSWRKERLLYKLGTAYRFQGEKERALDFFMKVLREYPSSSYKDRIEQMLRDETGIVAALSQPMDLMDADFQIELPDLEKAQKLVEIKQEKDKVYLQLVNALSKVRDEVPYELLQLYNGYKVLQKRFNEQIVVEQNNRLKDIKKRQQRIVFLIGFTEELTKKLKKSENMYEVVTRSFQDMASALINDSGLKPGIVVTRMPDSTDMERISIEISRLLEVYESSHIFVMVPQEQEVPADAFSDLSAERFRLLVTGGEEDNVATIRGMLHIRNLWQ
jgi:tetratricopeptide (TPR) repeat protein